MSLVDDLDHIRQRLGRSIVLPTPPACQDLLDQAKAAGIPVGTLFVLSRSLAPGVCGGYDRRTGDAWCHYDGGDEEGARDVLQCVLTLIAHAKLHFPPPTTIEEDWEHVRLAHREAASLAQAWDREDLFSASDLDAFLSEDAHLYNCHVAAGELAGNLAPDIARDTYHALLAVQQRYQWSDAQFEAALGGVNEDEEEANAVVLDFDRCSLREYWLSTSTRTWADEPHPFGQWTLSQTLRTARVLRSALERVAYPVEQEILYVPLQKADHTSLAFFRIECEQDLSLIIAHVNAWLLDHPACFARMRWTLYADTQWRETVTPLPHLYHMSLEYFCHGEKQADERSEPLRRDLWVLVPARKREELIEAAWQRYIRSWLTCADLHTDALYDGLQALWSGLRL
ncbi:hypothetical protein ccbrp13_61010 [Ktedonobacteria bacterium brp13]|nr:hypothetical protein ccbrp13_61010 [Ktedonobacteria bacterium brp13]